MKYKLQDIIDIEHFQSLQNRLNEIYSFSSAILDNEGNFLTATAWQDICTQFHRKNPACLKHCVESDQYILKHMQEANPAVTYLCPHGLVDNALPIIIDGVHYGNFFTGQFFLGKPDLEFFKKQAKKYNFVETAYLEAVRKVPILSQKQLDNYLFFIKELIGIISESGLNNLNEIQYRKNLESGEKHSKSILQAAMDGFWLTDEKGILLDVNDSYCKMSDYCSQELIGMHIGNLEADNSREEITTLIEKIKIEGAARFRSRHRRKSGSLFPVEVSIKYLPGSSGQFMIFIQDITERKLAEDMLIERRNRLEHATTSAKLGIWDWDIPNNTIIWDDQMYILYGLDRNTKASGIDLWKNGMHPDDLSYAREARQAAMRGDKKYDIVFRIIHPDGKIRFIKADGIVQFDDQDKAVRMIGINRDITGEKQAEQSLKEAKLFLDNMSDVAYIADTHGNLIWVNASTEKITGLSYDEMIGKPFLPLFIEKEHNSLIDVYSRTLKGESLENTLTFKSGINCHFSSIPKYNSDGKIVGTFGVARDITKRLKAEEELKVSEYRLKRAQQTAKIGNWEYDIQTGQIWGSEEAFRIYGIERTSEFLPLEQVQNCNQHASRVNQALVDLITLNKPYDIEFDIQPLNKSGITNIHSIAELIYDQEGIPLKVLGVIQDMTEHKQIEEMLRQSQKMEAIGQLAGGMAHDFNNVLSGIMSASQLLQLPKQGLNEKSLTYVSMIIQAAERASDLISKLLIFSRKSQIAITTLDIHEILNDVVAILEGTIDKRISISVIIGSHNPNFIGNLSAIESLFINLGINASHAMSNGGLIQIKTKNIFLDQKYCDSCSFEVTPGEFLQIEFIDTGCGIPKENLQKIFEPFYTTKEQGKGTGLGLSAVYGTVQDHHGMIVVQSEVGSGTTFYILLPCSEKQIEPVRETSPILTGAATILLVDDEEMNRILNKEIFESLGYKVHLAVDGLDAIEIFNNKHSEIDIVIMDMIMPRMNGSEAFYKMKEIDENCKVIIASGHTKDQNIDRLIENGLAGFINKPYRISEISQLLKNCIERGY